MEPSKINAVYWSASGAAGGYKVVGNLPEVGDAIVIELLPDGSMNLEAGDKALRRIDWFKLQSVRYYIVTCKGCGIPSDVESSVAPVVEKSGLHWRDWDKESFACNSCLRANGWRRLEV
jgi:hypothetical protein